MKWLVFIIFCLIGRGLWAQEVLFSPAQKVPSKINQYEILGKNSEGIIVWKSGPKYNLIEAYESSSLDLKWARELKIEGKKSRVFEIVQSQNDLFVFYTNKESSNIKLYVLQIDKKLRRVGEPILLDAYKRRFGSYSYQYKIKYDKSRSQFVVLKMFPKGGVDIYSNIELIWLNKNLEKQGTYSVNIESDWEFHDCVVLDNEQIYFVQKKIKRIFVSKSPLYDKVKVNKLHYSQEKGQEYMLENTNKEWYFNDLKFEWDHINEQLAVGGFYSANQSNKVLGIIYGYLDFDSKEQKLPVRVPFDYDLLQKAGYKTLFNQNNYIQGVEVRKLILRRDGGALLVGESHSTIGIQSQFLPSYDSRFENRGQTLKEHYYDDVLLFSINPTGEVLWDAVLQKKQYSENDNGYFSSIGFMNAKTSIYLLFNETIANNSNLNDFKVDSQGENRVKTLLNPSDYKLTPAPRYAKQISSSEIIIPSINYRNEFLLIKLKY